MERAGLDDAVAGDLHAGQPEFVDGMHDMASNPAVLCRSYGLVLDATDNEIGRDHRRRTVARVRTSLHATHRHTAALTQPTCPIPGDTDLRASAVDVECGV